MPNPPAARLLVVDDEPSLRIALQNTLRDEGYDVAITGSGAEALVSLRTAAFDLVLTDLIMPEMDGISLLQQALVLDPNLVGVVMTGHGSIPTAVAAMKTGAIDYVQKPISLSGLVPVLERALVIRRLRVRNAELEKRVRERTAELEIANQDLEAFSSSVSHDLRSPLRAISGFAELIVGRHGASLAEDARRHLELIQGGAGEMAQMIDGLLAFSRFGRQAIVRESVDIAQLSRDVFRHLARDYAGRQVELRVAPLPIASGDRVLLRHVMINLLSNAVKYTRPRALATIDVGVAMEGTDREVVYFVRDNGVGFDPRYVDQLFNVFQRLHTPREFEGTGVGLATVRRIVERHGGRIWAEATVDAGATFYFTLPDAEARPAEPAEA